MRVDGGLRRLQKAVLSCRAVCWVSLRNGVTMRVRCVQAGLHATCVVYLVSCGNIHELLWLCGVKTSLKSALRSNKGIIRVKLPKLRHLALQPRAQWHWGGLLTRHFISPCQSPFFWCSIFTFQHFCVLCQAKSAIKIATSSEASCLMGQLLGLNPYRTNVENRVSS